MLGEWVSIWMDTEGISERQTWQAQLLVPYPPKRDKRYLQ